MGAAQRWRRRAMLVRRITVELDKPTRDGEAAIHILTNLPAEDADAGIAIYRRRWTWTAFGQLASHGGRGGVFAFCVALVSYNVMSVVKAALRSVHGEEAVEGLSVYYLADEVAGTHRGMMIAIPEDEWAVFHGLTAAIFGRVLLAWPPGSACRPTTNTVRGPKRPQPKRESGAKVNHVSTAKLLGKRKGST